MASRLWRSLEWALALSAMVSLYFCYQILERTKDRVYAGPSGEFERARVFFSPELLATRSEVMWIHAANVLIVLFVLRRLVDLAFVARPWAR